MNDQPEALRLAAFCDGNVLYHPAAAELRRLHDETLMLNSAYESACKIISEQDKKLAELETVNQELIKAYNKMRNSAAGYSNFCDDNANTRRCERDFVAAEALYRAVITRAEGEKT
jgi:hypothetical protein